MIQFNLLPDVKLEYIKAQNMRRMILTSAVIVSLLALTVLGVLIGANQLGKKHLSDLSRDITNQSRKLQNEPNIDSILTIQNQLESLTALHGMKPAASRTFDYLNRLTPAKVSLTSYNTDLTTQVVTLSGTADALSTVNQYVDTLKVTSYSTTADGTTSAKLPAFSDVVLSSFGLTASTKTDQAASYSITMKYDPLIFDITKSVTLTVPSTVTTRTGVVQPSELFTATPAPAAKPTTTGGTR